jgi:YebC/PmpR family DNA-binding regulatory protein
MARHSHWHNIQLKKGKTDAKRAGAFSKLAKNITVAARDGGGDPAFNFKLRMAVDAAKAVSMPRDNIERAIARGTGGGEGGVIEEVVYEGFGPGGVAMVVVCLTDNRNRSVADVKTAASKNGGSIGASGSVMWMFEKKGVVSIMDASTIKSRDAFDLAMIDAGADDIQEMDGGLRVLCSIPALQSVVAAVNAQGATLGVAAIEYVAKTTTEVTDNAVADELVKFIEIIDDLDDVDAVYTNEA